MAKLPKPPKKVATRPTGKASLDGFYKHFDVVECLCFVSMALERAGLDINALGQPQFTLFEALKDPLDEEALADMLAYWTFNLNRLAEDRQARPAKPKIDVRLQITTKGNLKVEWFPRDCEWANIEQSDIPHFRRYEHRSAEITSRPSNELMFLRGFQDVLHHFLGDFQTGASPLNTVLLAACGKAVARLKDRLAYHFDVRMLTDAFLEWEEIEIEGSCRWNDSYRLVSWQIDDPAVRRRAAELIELEALEQRHGFSESALIEVAQFLAGKAGKGDEWAWGDVPADKIGKELRSRGFALASKRGVERAVALIAKHRQAEQPTNVVPLRP